MITVLLSHLYADVRRSRQLDTSPCDVTSRLVSSVLAGQCVMAFSRPSYYGLMTSRNRRRILNHQRSCESGDRPSTEPFCEFQATNVRCRQTHIVACVISVQLHYFQRTTLARKSYPHSLITDINKFSYLMDWRQRWRHHQEDCSVASQEA